VAALRSSAIPEDGRHLVLALMATILTKPLRSSAAADGSILGSLHRDPLMDRSEAAGMRESP
jgi:hypothetical protein